MLESLRYQIDRSAKLAKAFPVVVEQAHCQRTDLRRELVLEHTQSGRLLRSHPPAPPRRQIMADAIGDRVGFPSSRWTLNHNAPAHRPALRALDLLGLEGLGDKPPFAAPIPGGGPRGAVDAPTTWANANRNA